MALSVVSEKQVSFNYLLKLFIKAIKCSQIEQFHSNILLEYSNILLNYMKIVNINYTW